MKKILIFVPTFSNLSETFILREIDALDKSDKVDVHVVSLKEGKAELPGNLKPKVSYIPLRFTDVLNSLPFISKKLSKILQVGWRFFQTSQDGFLRNLKNYLKGILFAFKLSKFDYDQIHIHFLSDISTIIGLAAQINAKPFSISGHARDIFIDGSAVNFKVKNAKFITLCNSKAFLKCLELSGGKGRKNVVLGFHGIDPQLYKFSERNLNIHKEINIITDGRFTPKKGLVTLSKAIVSLIKDYKFKINLTIIGLAIGDDQQKILNEVKDIFKQAKVYDHLEIPGNGKGVQQEEVVKYYDRSHVFIYAGINAPGGDADGVPNGLLQAAFSGLPVITTTSGSISDLFNQKNSFIIEQNSVDSIIEKFNELVLDKKLADKISMLNKEVLENFEIKKNISYLEHMLLK